ncbi:MAG TPA: hypothetical protein ENJ79_09130 [Gammaproteobacteria bacterium]|nr:hypothetical protein [Gammaproteobacteria bacterium]
MAETDRSALQRCLDRYRGRVPGLPVMAPAGDVGLPGTRLTLYEQCFPRLEQLLWSGVADFDTLLADYQALFREYEALHAQAEAQGLTPPRHHFIISIPVADRPHHLRACLESILCTCQYFGYGGQEGKHYRRIEVVIAEDSQNPDHVRQHREIAAEYLARGLLTHHFGLEEQYQLLQAAHKAAPGVSENLLTTQPKERFYLKGQAANRNLSYLKCLELTQDPARTLYYFVDSDERFCVDRPDAQATYALNYFHYIDRAFHNSDVLLLTGKMVGDPPVSPSVMTANFLGDVTDFFTRLAHYDEDSPCRFHGSAPSERALRSAAIYHDMAGLFGFDDTRNVLPYRCPIEGPHDHAQCLHHLAGRLPAFFFGVHLTRKTYFSLGDGLSRLTPARTLYPGNYIARHEGLKYPIPFGHLRLRMSGPTTGRLLAAGLGERFATINLPHLHCRTTGNDLAASFRPGVQTQHERTDTRIDIGDEYERQFFGDLMLFTTEALARAADLDKPFLPEQVQQQLDTHEHELLHRYRRTREDVLSRNRVLRECVDAPGRWWSRHVALEGAMQQVHAFLDNVDYNFGRHSPAWQKIGSKAHRVGRKAQILSALSDYHNTRKVWQDLLERMG